MSDSFFRNLAVLSECVEKSPQLGRGYWRSVRVDASSKNRPTDCMNELRSWLASSRELSNSAHETYHLVCDQVRMNVRMMRHRNRILDYMEHEVERYTECDHMTFKGMSALSSVVENEHRQILKPTSMDEDCFASSSDSSSTTEVAPVICVTPNDDRQQESHRKAEITAEIRMKSDATRQIIERPLPNRIPARHRSMSESYPPTDLNLEGVSGVRSIDDLKLESPKIASSIRSNRISIIGTPTYPSFYFSKRFIDCAANGDNVSKQCQKASKLTPIPSHIEATNTNSPELRSRGNCGGLGSISPNRLPLRSKDGDRLIVFSTVLDII